MAAKCFEQLHPEVAGGFHPDLDLSYFEFSCYQVDLFDELVETRWLVSKAGRSSRISEVIKEQRWHSVRNGQSRKGKQLFLIALCYFDRS
ncbi:MAG: hypothetical protein ABFD49_11080 [Armatimonadota bacterium]|nr:hypothetical protein [bacterium]